MNSLTIGENHSNWKDLNGTLRKAAGQGRPTSNNGSPQVVMTGTILRGL